VNAEGEGILVSITLILPTLNEASNIIPMLEAVHAFVDHIVVVDDSSSDGTANLARGFKGNVTVIERKNAKGLNSAIMTGAQMAKTDRVIIMDTDFSHPPETVPQIVKALERFDLVIGTRGKIENWSFHRRFMSLAATFLTRFHARRIKDPLSGFFGIRRDLLLKYGKRCPPEGYKILYTVLKHYLAERSTSGIAELSYEFNGREQGASKLGTRQILSFVRNVLFS
jgi:dolichol-phosphate mannosyltransferase